jgi:hypothetical protein
VFGQDYPLRYSFSYSVDGSSEVALFLGSFNPMYSSAIFPEVGELYSAHRCNGGMAVMLISWRDVLTVYRVSQAMLLMSPPRSPSLTAMVQPPSPPRKWLYATLRVKVQYPSTL